MVATNSNRSSNRDFAGVGEVIVDGTGTGRT